MDFKDRLKDLRKRRGYSQAALADKLGLSKSTIGAYETGDIVPSIEALELIADFFGVDLDYLAGRNIRPRALDAIRIKVYGSIPAGIPLEAIEDVIGWEEISPEMTFGGKEYFGLKVKGDSMLPKYLDGDIIIVQRQTNCDSGDDCVVYVNGNEATLKKVIKRRDCIVLQPLNTQYEPMIYSYDEGEKVRIAGVVKELRRKI